MNWMIHQVANDLTQERIKDGIRYAELRRKPNVYMVEPLYRRLLAYTVNLVRGLARNTAPRKSAVRPVFDPPTQPIPLKR
jgi:hypothetical protein